ncbi:MAG: radical SAM protein [Candidatus Omnitrophica bacterium]|nr:radical SAM protein [Candidatus Omnitrophota bacterium]
MIKYPKAPIEIELAVTGKCNLRCKHCMVKGTHDTDGRGELTTKELFALFDELKKCKIFKLSLLGGEPFVRSDILEVLDRIRTFPAEIQILTNGTTVNKGIITRLKRIKYLKNVQVSLDGGSPATHDWQRGAGSFAKTLKGIKLLRSAKINCLLKCIINRRNFSEMDKMVSLSRGLGLKGMAFGDAVECGYARTHKKEIRLTAEVYRISLLKIAELKKKYADFLFYGTLPQMLELVSSFKKNGAGNGKRGSFGACPAGTKTLGIRHDGWAIPCSAFWTYKLGNIRDKSVTDIWQNSPLLNRIRALRDVPLCGIGECRDCQFIKYCNGGCRAAGYYLNNGDLKGLDRTKCAVYSTDSLSEILKGI